MKVEDFEKAVDALSCSVHIDEMKLRGSHVRQCLGHTDTLLILWDDGGRAFGIDVSDCHDPQHEDYNTWDYDRRMTDFDLKFE